MKTFFKLAALTSVLALSGCDNKNSSIIPEERHPLKNGPRILTDEDGNKWIVSWEKGVSIPGYSSVRVDIFKIEPYIYGSAQPKSTKPAESPATPQN